MNSNRRLLPVSVLALIALLVFAASAAAEVRTGEASSEANPALEGGIDLLKATASYDSSSGATSFQVTTRESPTEPEEAELFIALLSAQTCDASVFTGGQSIAPVLIARTPYAAPQNPNEPAAEYNFFETQPPPGEPGNPVKGPVSKTIDGNTATLAVTVPQAANRQFNCVAAEARESNQQNQSDFVVFPLTVQQEAIPTPPVSSPSPPVAVQTITKTVSPPPPAPAALSLPRIKPVSAGPDKWTKVRLAVTNTGGTAAGPVTLKVKAPRGIVLKPTTLKLAALLAGQTWTLPVFVKATEEAKKVSAIGLTASLPGISATSSFTVRSTS